MNKGLIILPIIAGVAAVWAMNSESWVFIKWAVAFGCAMGWISGIQNRIAAFMFSILLTVVMAVVAWQSEDTGPSWGWGIGSFFMGCFAMVTLGSKKCPWCDNRINVEKKSCENCTNCQNPVANADGEYFRMFAAPLPEQFYLPEACCVCGQPATHLEAVKTTEVDVFTSAIALPLAGRILSYESSLEVPYCDHHSNGAFFKIQGRVIFFASEAYRDAFCEVNQISG